LKAAVLLAMLAIPGVATAQGISVGLWVDTLDIAGTKDMLLSWAGALDIPEEALNELSAMLGELPNLVPVPLVGISLGIPLGQLELQLEGALLTDGVLRNFGLWPGQGVDLAELHLDFMLRAYHLALGISPRLDLGIIAVALAAGLSLSGGDLFLQAAMDAAQLTWGAGGGTLGAQLELGLPFLRLFASGAVFLPWGQVQDTWNVRVGPWQGKVGVVIRF